MVFEEQSVKGCYLIKRNIPWDDRGYFSRLADVDEFRSNGLNSKFVQISVSRNYKKGTLRGLHMQIKPSAEEKLVCCVDGEIFDVCVDLRKDSDTYLKYCFAILSEENGEDFYIPKGCAHGFISLKDETRLIYLKRMIRKRKEVIAGTIRHFPLSGRLFRKLYQIRITHGL